MRPRVVLITGEPGSGKTTLGRELARELRVPFLARDDVRGGLYFTAGAWSDRPGAVPSSDDAVEAFLRTVETMSELGVSSVVEYVVRRRRPEDLRRIVARADCVVIWTSCRDPLDRFVRRATQDRLLNRRPVLDALGYVTAGEHTRDAAARMRTITDDMQTQFTLPLLRVDTDSGYEPGIEGIIEFATAGTAQP